MSKLKASQLEKKTQRKKPRILHRECKDFFYMSKQGKFICNGSRQGKLMGLPTRDWKG